MSRLGRWCVRNRFGVLGIWILISMGLTFANASLGANYQDSFNLKGSDSMTAYTLLSKGFGAALSGDTDYVVFKSTDSIKSPRTEKAISDIITRIQAVPSVGAVDSPLYVPSQVNLKKNIAYAVVHFTVSAMTLNHKNTQAVLDTRSLAPKGLQVEFGGRAIEELNRPTGNIGESVGIAAAAIVLILAFGSILAMFLPIGVALFALGTASALVGLLTHVITIATFAPQLGSLIGLGVGIDYALFIVTRYRQGLFRGLSVEEAAVTAVNTSGRAILFAGTTVCVALLGMLVLGLSFLNGVAVAASITVAVTMAAAVTLLPALLKMMGMHALSRKQRRRLAEEGPRDDGHHPRWEQWSNYVSRKPLVLALASFGLVALLVTPYFSLHLGNADAGSDAPSSTTRKAYDLLSEGFGPGFNGPLQVVVPIANAKDYSDFEKLAIEMSSTPNVVAISPTFISQDHSVAFVNLYTGSGPSDKLTSDTIKILREDNLPRWTKYTNLHPYVGGTTAIFDDFATSITHKLPLFIGVIVLLGCLLLMIAFRSLLIPATAAVMNLLAAGASFGFVVALFQWGWGESLLNVGRGPVESFLPVMMIAILFGLSMDYQVFLVSRMHEEWVHTKDNRLAIVRGQSDTGRVITAAGLIMILVFFSFVLGGQRVIAEFGVGLGIAVLIDAFIIRTILVPALMHLIGDANWWLPAAMEAKLPHLAVEAPDEASAPTN